MTAADERQGFKIPPAGVFQPHLQQEADCANWWANSRNHWTGFRRRAEGSAQRAGSQHDRSWKSRLSARTIRAQSRAWVTASCLGDKSDQMLTKGVPGFSSSPGHGQTY